jgi:hypothetical protein
MSNTSLSLIAKIMEDGNFNAGSGWNNSKIGYHWGGAAVQGVYVETTHSLLLANLPRVVFPLE